MLSRLIVLYDDECGFCLRCRAWLLEQAQYVRLEFVPRTSAEVSRRMPDLPPPEERDELVVVDDEGGVYRGPAAFLMCLWALVEYREWSLRLASPSVLPLARKAIHLVSSRRQDLAWWLNLRSERDLAVALRRVAGSGPPRCARDEPPPRET